MRTKLQRLACMDKEQHVIDQMVEKCYPLVVQQLRKFYLYNDPDALSHAYEALYKAIITYEPDGRSQFITYATVCIYNSLGSYLRVLKNAQQAISLHTIISDNGEELMDVVSTDEVIADNVVGEITADLYRSIARQLVTATNNDNQRNVLTMWMESDYEMRHTDLAVKAGMSQSYVTQTINTFRAKMRKELEVIGHGNRY